MDTVALHSLISGERRGAGPALLRGGLSIASWFYSAGVRARNRAFNLGWKQTSRAAIPVISIGNITTGGTGKTPFAAHLARWFRERNVRVCFLSRGYGGEQGQSNEEALVLDQLCPDVPHLQHPDRVAGAQIAVEELEMQLLILDDGFQHRRLARDLDIVLIDALEPWGYGHLLPRGLLREPRSALRRAGLIVITRADQVSSETRQQLRHTLQQIRDDDRCVEVAFTPQRLINASGESASLDSLRGQPISAFCGIGNPVGFRRTLSDIGLPVTDAQFRIFPDHHRYTREDVETLTKWAATYSLSALVTTLKDQVKIPVDKLGATPLWSIDIGTTVLANEHLLTEQLDRIHRLIPASVEPTESDQPAVP